MCRCHPYIESLPTLWYYRFLHNKHWPSNVQGSIPGLFIHKRSSVQPPFIRIILGIPFITVRKQCRIPGSFATCPAGFNGQVYNAQHRSLLSPQITVLEKVHGWQCASKAGYTRIQCKWPLSYIHLFEHIATNHVQRVYWCEGNIFTCMQTRPCVWHLKVGTSKR